MTAEVFIEARDYGGTFDGGEYAERRLIFLGEHELGNIDRVFDPAKRRSDEWVVCVPGCCFSGKHTLTMEDAARQVVLAHVRGAEQGDAIIAMWIHTALGDADPNTIPVRETIHPHVAGYREQRVAAGKRATGERLPTDPPALPPIGGIARWRPMHGEMPEQHVPMQGS